MHIVFKVFYRDIQWNRNLNKSLRALLLRKKVNKHSLFRLKHIRNCHIVPPHNVLNIHYILKLNSILSLLLFSSHFEKPKPESDLDVCGAFT